MGPAVIGDGDWVLEALYNEAARRPPPMTAVPKSGAEDFKTRCENIVKIVSGQ